MVCGCGSGVEILWNLVWYILDWFWLLGAQIRWEEEKKNVTAENNGAQEKKDILLKMDKMQIKIA